jgi:monoamine oxidase
VSASHVTRSRLPGGAAATGAALALPAGVEARTRPCRRVEVAIVGAGLAGLTAARELTRAGHEVCVLEARDRVGGRTLNERVSKGVISELGAQYIGPTMDHIAALAKAVGVKTFPTYNEGSNVQYLGGERSLYPATSLPTAPEAVQLTVALLGLDPLAAQVPVNAPWKAKRAAEWDRMTLADYVNATVTTSIGKALASTAFEAIWGAEARELSLLYALYYIAAGGNESTKGTIAPFVTTEGGTQQDRFVGGSQRVSLEVARRLGDRVVLRSPVRRIDTGGGCARILSDRLIVQAQRVIVAVPPILATRIAFSPVLPRAKRTLLRRLAPGRIIKWEAVYETPFWREQGLSGQVASDTGPANSTFDNSPPGGRPGILFGFIGGDQARRAAKLSASELRTAVLGNFATYFGDQALTPIDTFRSRWSEDPWTRGCPVGFARPGLLTAYGPALRAITGRVHWAGTETSIYWNGYMDGAVRSGERAAAEAARRLR